MFGPAESFLPYSSPSQNFFCRIDKVRNSDMCGCIFQLFVISCFYSDLTFVGYAKTCSSESSGYRKLLRAEFEVS